MEKFIRRLEWIKDMIDDTSSEWQAQYKAKVAERERGLNKEPTVPEPQIVTDE